MNHPTPNYKFSIGTRFIPRGKKNRVIRTVVDYGTTYNNAGSIVKQRYITAHQVCGQIVLDRDVVETTIAMSEVAP